MRKGAAIILLLFVFGAIAGLFWKLDWIYNLPTPVPKNYHAVNKGEKINLSAQFRLDQGKPLLIHFYNPDCPCSRFNMPHFKSLVNEYEGKINFAIAVMNNKNYTTKDIQAKFGFDIPVFNDSSIAVACGVYSTPQAVLIDTANTLFYRGNYNRTRYCADKKTEYARLAIVAKHQNVIKNDTLNY